MSKFALSGRGCRASRFGKLSYVLEHGCGGAGGCVIEWREVRWRSWAEGELSELPCAEERWGNASDGFVGLRDCGGNWGGWDSGCGLRCGWVGAVHERGWCIWISLCGGVGEVRGAGCEGNVGERLGAGGSLPVQRSGWSGGDGGVLRISEGQI